MRSLQFIGWMLATALALASTPALAQNLPQTVGWVTSATGQVSVTSNINAAPVPLRTGQEISTGMTIATGSGSAVRLLMKGDNVITISQNSKITITQYLVGPQKSVSQFDLLVGKIRAAVASKLLSSNSVFEIRTKNAVAGVRGSMIGVEYNPQNNSTLVGCGEGECYIKVNGQTITVPINQILSVLGNQAGKPGPLQNGQPGSYNPKMQYDGKAEGNDSDADKGAPEGGQGEGGNGGGGNYPKLDLDSLLLETPQNGAGNYYERFGAPFQPPMGPGITHGNGER